MIKQTMRETEHKDFYPLSPDHDFCVFHFIVPGNAFAGSAGTSFTPHIITASPSEVYLYLQICSARKLL
jgi:hypothetical protein